MTDTVNVPVALLEKLYAAAWVVEDAALAGMLKHQHGNPELAAELDGLMLEAVDVACDAANLLPPSSAPTSAAELGQKWWGVLSQAS